MSRSILVAGGAGYIGSQTARQLACAGWQPVVLDNFVTGNRGSLQFGPFVQGDIQNQTLVRKTIEHYAIDAVILFAAHAYVGESTSSPAKYYQNNVVNAISFLEALRLAGVGKIVFSSSCSVYGNQPSGPLHEDLPTGPLSPYAESKLILEQVLRWYDSAYGFRSVSLRYFNAAGADPDARTGESHNPETHLIPLAIFAAMGRGSLNIFGADYPTPDGTALRDYIHVCDLADAHIRALHYLDELHPTTTINLGAGVGTSVFDIMRAVEEISGKRVPHTLAPRRPGDAPVLVANAAKALRLLGWQPRHSAITNIIETAWRWHANQPW